MLTTDDLRCLKGTVSSKHWVFLHCAISTLKYLEPIEKRGRDFDHVTQRYTTNLHFYPVK